MFGFLDATDTVGTDLSDFILKDFFTSPRLAQPRCTTSYTTMQYANRHQLTFQEAAYRREWSSHLQDSSVELNTLSLLTNLPPTKRRALLMKEMDFCLATRDGDFERGMIQAHSFHIMLWKCSKIPWTWDEDARYPFTYLQDAFIMGTRKYVDWESMIVWVSVSEIYLQRWMLPVARGMIGFDILLPEFPIFALTPSIRWIRYFHRIVSPLVHRLPFFKPLNLKEGTYNAPPPVAPGRYMGAAHHIIIQRDPGLVALPWETQTTPCEREEARRRRLRRSHLRHERARRSDVSDATTLVEVVEEEFYQPQEY